MRKPQPDVLIVEDNPGDVRLIVEAWQEGADRCRFSVVANGEEGLEFLRREGRYADAPRPALILSDLNMPQMSGIEFLAEIKKDEDLKRIPVVILTSSMAEQDIRHCYDLHANCYVVKPTDLDRFIRCMHAIKTFWFDHVLLPER
jgi:two-component system, chemotaxis family, response regulator Rcp1